MGGRIAALARKEISQLLRDVPMLLIFVWAFTGAVYTGGHGMATELHNYPIAVVDLSRSAASRSRLEHSTTAFQPRASERSSSVGNTCSSGRDCRW